LKKFFAVGGGQQLRAVNGVDLDIYKGETLSLVGESGSGKSTLGKSIMGVYPPTEGSIHYAGQPFIIKRKKDRIAFSRRAQMIFQDPYASLNPRKTVAAIVGEGIDIHGLYRGRERLGRIHELLELVGLRPEMSSRYPHEFSGGQRQRIGIARALSLGPEFIVSDEPISALDVSIQAQIVNLLRSLQRELSLTHLFIAHDLNMVRYISDRVAVMYLGSIVELADSKAIYAKPLHPYTQGLLSAVPAMDPGRVQPAGLEYLKGEIPSPVGNIPGCAFCTRCSQAMPVCETVKPQPVEAAPGHTVACHLYTT
jgi:oligopeptide transport system ATP-binding protein